ncbi:MAG: hypothetical protein ACK4IX_15335, partial [Candidatus Sericytochromatia bacterium]
GALTVIGYSADKSQMVATIAKKGLVPAAGAGLAIFGTAMAYDGAVNDLKDNKLKCGAKIAGGTLIALSGTEIFGRSVGIEVLRPMSKIAPLITTENIIGKGVYGVGGATGVYFAGKSMKEKGVTIGNALGMAAGATASSIGFSLSLDDVGIRSEKPMMVAAGLGLGLTSYAFGKNTIKGIEEKNYTKSFVSGSLGVASAVGSAHLLGYATGVKALENIGGKLVTNLPLTAGIAATTFAAGAYYMYAKDK